MGSGCPPDLSLSFSAVVRSQGQCRRAWLNGAIVEVMNSKSKDIIKIWTHLIKKKWTLFSKNSFQDGEVYQQVFFRSRKIGAVEFSLINKFVSFLERQKNTCLAGLQYEVSVTCPNPDCSEVTRTWDPDSFSEKIECTKCGEFVDASCYNMIPKEQTAGTNAFYITKNSGLFEPVYI